MNSDPTYRPENLLSRPIDTYAIATVIPESEL
jgi:hypothetical protein